MDIIYKKLIYGLKLFFIYFHILIQNLILIFKNLFIY